jgi:hypothetical protein
LKILAWDGQGLVLYAKRLERGKFVWPQAKEGAVSLTPAQVVEYPSGDGRLPVLNKIPMLRSYVVFMSEATRAAGAE